MESKDSIAGKSRGTLFPFLSCSDEDVNKISFATIFPQDAGSELGLMLLQMQSTLFNLWVDRLRPLGREEVIAALTNTDYDNQNPGLPICKWTLACSIPCIRSP